MSSHELSFPYTGSRNRDLSDAELWERSLRRSVHRREITEAARKHAMRRKGAAVAVTASMAAGPVAAPFAAVASVGGSRSVSGSTDTGSSSTRAALSLPSGALVKFGDTGKAWRVVPGKVYQAACAARAIVTTDTPAMRAAFDPDEVVLVPRGDPDGLAIALRGLIKDRARVVELGRRARARFERDYTPAP